MDMNAQKSCKLKAWVQKSTLLGLMFDSKSFSAPSNKYDEASI